MGEGACRLIIIPFVGPSLQFSNLFSDSQKTCMDIMPFDSTPTPTSYFLLPQVTGRNASLLRSSRHHTTGEAIEIILIVLEKSVVDYSAVAKIWENK